MSAKVIADSISPAGDRLTTLEVRFHRFVLAEFNTHRALSRNSASSRAIPVEKQLARVQEDPAWPVVWPAEQPGMQGGSDLTGAALRDAQALLADVWAYTTERVAHYVAEHPDKADRLHKSVVNRVLEPFMWHTVICSSTEWANFFGLRCNPMAQPEIRVAAEAMQAALDASTPVRVDYGDWHLPYVDDDDRVWAKGADVPDQALQRISAARCARVSYLTHDGVRNPDKDLELYDRLVSAIPAHASPLEHVARPFNPGLGPVLTTSGSINFLTGEGSTSSSTPLTRSAPGNFRGWAQLRHLVTS